MTYVLKSIFLTSTAFCSFSAIHGQSFSISLYQIIYINISVVIPPIFKKKKNQNQNFLGLYFLLTIPHFPTLFYSKHFYVQFPDYFFISLLPFSLNSRHSFSLLSQPLYSRFTHQSQLSKVNSHFSSDFLPDHPPGFIFPYWLFLPSTLLGIFFQSPILPIWKASEIDPCSSFLPCLHSFPS